MNARFFQRIGWISLILAFAVVNAADCGTLTAVQMIWGSLLGVSGFLFALHGQCRMVQRTRRMQRMQTVRVPVRVHMNRRNRP